MPNCKNLKEMLSLHPIILALLFFIKIVYNLMISVLNPFIYKFLRKQAVSGFVLGSIVSLTFVFSFISSMFFGHYSEWSNLGRTLILTVGLVTMGVCFIVIAFTKNLIVLSVTFCFLGCGFAAVQTNVFSIILDIYPVNLTTLCLSFVEFGESVGWVLGPLILYLLKKGMQDKMEYAILSVGILIILTAAATLVVFTLKLNPLKKVEKNADVIKISVKAQLKVLLSKKVVYIASIIIMLNCFCYYLVSISLGINTLNDLENTVYFIIPSIPLAVILVPVLSKRFSKKWFVIITPLAIGVLNVFTGGAFVDLRKYLPNLEYIVVRCFVIFFRDLIFMVSYVFCNLIVMEAIALKNPKLEMNGFCTAFFIFNLSLGESVAVILANGLDMKLGYDNMTWIAGAVSGLSFACGLIINVLF